MMIDLEEPRFTQNEVLRMLPNLKAKQLQNWNQRGVLDEGDQRPGKAGKRRYTPIGLITLDFMQQVNRYGVPPSEAFEMAAHVAQVAFQFVNSNPKVIMTAANHKWIPLGHDEVAKMRRGIIDQLEDGRFFILMEGNGAWSVDQYNDRVVHTVGIAVEVEILIASCINRIFLLEAGLV